MNIDKLLKSVDAFHNYSIKLAQQAPADPQAKLSEVLTTQLNEFVQDEAVCKKVVAAAFPPAGTSNQFSRFVSTLTLALYIDSDKIKSATNEYDVRKALSFQLFPSNITLQDKSGKQVATDQFLAGKITQQLAAVARTDLYPILEDEIVKANYNTLGAYKAETTKGPVTVQSKQATMTCLVG